MTRVILVRHGETEYNSGPEPRLRGWRDIPLNAKGKQDALETAKNLCDRENPDKIYTSRLQRASYVAYQIQKVCGKPVILLPGAMSWNHGVLSGQKASSVEADMKAFSTTRRDEAPAGGESFNAFLHRWIGALSHITADQEHTAVICTHLQNCMTGQTWVQAGMPKDLKRMPYRYAKEDEIAPGDWIVLRTSAQPQVVRGGATL